VAIVLVPLQLKGVNGTYIAKFHEQIAAKTVTRCAASQRVLLKVQCSEIHTHTSISVISAA
jgi:hypothetical protein